MIPLKNATVDKHKQAERMPFNDRMIKGLLSKEEYLLYLNQQVQIFMAIEKKGLPSDNLARTTSIQDDIDELHAQGVYSESILSSTETYLDYLDPLTYQEVLPHIYLNYLALMFGGQMIKKAVPSTGRMYDFDNMQDAIRSVREVQEDSWADEVNRGFDFIISIMEELETVSVNG